MNVAILGANQLSQIVANVTELHVNSWRRSILAEPINVIAYVDDNVWGGV